MRVVELFAGVGGFRLGLEKYGKYKVVWSNQYEPRTKIQHASMVYEARFGKKNHSNENIETVPTTAIPDHDLLVGGFPCQDYSVATTLKNAKGLLGKKGVLWWSIHRILTEKKQRPAYLFLENVDRLLKSPSSQRGRDFAVMLKSLNDLGYAVEWRVINAAEYGMPQRRRRVYMLGYHQSSSIFKNIKAIHPLDFFNKKSIITQAFPIQNIDSQPIHHFILDDDLVNISNDFNKGGKKSLFQNTGLMLKGQVYTAKTIAQYIGPFTTLEKVLEPEPVPAEFYVPEKDVERWQYLKGAKKEKRVTKEGFEYNYSEGGMIFPDALDKPSRTIITGEGGRSPSRFKHVITTANGLRRLTPLELERLNMFPDNHTLLEGISNTKRAFFMGNALVVGVVERIGEVMYENNLKSN